MKRWKKKKRRRRRTWKAPMTSSAAAVVDGQTSTPYVVTGAIIFVHLKFTK